MKNRNKILVILLSICLITPLFDIVAQAASGSVSISSASGNVGSTVSVTCTIKCKSGPIGTADVVLKYDSSGLKYVSGTGGYSLKGGSGSISYSGLTSEGTETSLSFTVKFKIKKEGSFSIKTQNIVVYNLDEEQLTVSGTSAKVKGKAESSNSNSNGNSNSNSNTTKPVEDKRDKNNKLNSLEVSPGTLAPAFHADKTSYTVTVPGETMDVTITAAAQSRKAKVSVSGGKDLKLGENTAKVVVTAENDSTKVYNITIVCGEVEKISIDGVENTINESFTDEQIPTNFERTKLTYNGREYEGVVNESGTLKLMSLKHDKSATFYRYNEETQEFQTFAQVKIASGKYAYPMPLNEANEMFADYEKTTVTIKKKVFDAWKLDDEFSVITALNQDGEEVLYRYDSVDETLQRYVEIEKVEEVVEEPIEEEPAIPTEYYLYAIAGLGALVLILLITVIYFMATRKSKHKVRKNKAQKKAEKLAEKQEE